MRKLFTILALLGMAVGFSAQGARADLTGPANLQFFDSSAGGLFSLTFPGVNNFDGEFFGPQMFSLNSTDMWLRSSRALLLSPGHWVPAAHG